jgi:hypothetical protein
MECAPAKGGSNLKLQTTIVDLDAEKTASRSR